MNGRQIRELRQLAEGLPNVPTGKFKMNTWGQGMLRPDREGFDCPFAGCAIGWMPKLVPGSKLRFEKYGRFQHPTYKGAINFRAIGLRRAAWFFNPNSYNNCPITPDEVSRRILDFLATKQEKGTR
jgi:hypothetical protein